MIKAETPGVERRALDSDNQPPTSETLVGLRAAHPHLGQDGRGSTWGLAETPILEPRVWSELEVLRFLPKTQAVPSDPILCSKDLRHGVRLWVICFSLQTALFAFGLCFKQLPSWTYFLHSKHHTSGSSAPWSLDFSLLLAGP